MDYFSGLASRVSASVDAAFDSSFDTGVSALNDILRLEGNNMCADCAKPNPRWVHMGFAIFLCSRCAGMHGMLSGGSHVGSLRSAEKMAPAQIRQLRDGGNATSNQKHRRTPPPDDLEEPAAVAQYIERKYYTGKKQQKPSVTGAQGVAATHDAAPAEDLLLSNPCMTPTSELLNLVGDTGPVQVEQPSAQQAVMNAFHQMPSGSMSSMQLKQSAMPVSNPQMPALMPSPSQMSQIQPGLSSQFRMDGNRQQATAGMNLGMFKHV
eukprot:TRINITY_DN54410_c0_g1_i1.p1 TRINITY_DN54410_c0_g1~~TRINITY_DN54410_c0_g1_i1.p1  ORF type:complete len:265 (-),score=46.95 TRINITY_DN54410_c0_g1_i1:307-1101(-)